jgi:hypothetical protein
LHDKDVADLIATAKAIVADVSVLLQETGLIFTTNGMSSAKRVIERLDAHHKQINAPVVSQAIV